MMKIILVFVIGISACIAMYLLWALSCFLCTRFVDLEKDCTRHSKVFRFHANRIIDSLILFLHIKLEVKGTEILPEGKFLLVGNHRSAMDPILEMGALRKYNPGFIAKQELFKIPVIGRVMHKSFCLPLDRENSRKDARTVLKAIKLLKEQTAVIGIYPEGRRNEGEGLLPFKNGAFKIAQKSGSPIVVAVIRNSEKIMKNAPFKKTEVSLEFIGTLDEEYVRYHNSAKISEAVRSMMEKALDSGSEEYRKVGSGGGE